MKKKSVAVVLLISVLLIFSISLISAGFWSDIWKGITGRVVGNETNELIAHYKFDGNAQDSAGNNHGTVYGNPQYVSGVNGYALNFDGTDDYIKLNKANLASNGPMTVSIWVYATGNYVSLYNIGAHDKESVWLHYYIDGDSRFTIGTDDRGSGRLVTRGANNHAYETSIGKTFSDAWTNIVIVLNSDGDVESIYKNGVYAKNMYGASGYNENGWTFSGTDTIIGRHGSTSSKYFKGLIDEVKIWNYALSATQIQNEYGSITPPANATCTDSDGGKNYGVKGTTSGIWGVSGNFETHVDVCDTGPARNMLYEYFCTSPTNMYVNYTQCPNGCQNGSCVQGNETNATCTNYCNYIGQTVCAGSDSNILRTCGDYGTNGGCLEWDPYPFTTCPNGCSNGACIGENVTTYCGDGICSGASERTINDGETITSNHYGLFYTISVVVEDTNTATITVDGVSKSYDEGWTGTINGLPVYIKNVVGLNVAGAIRYVELVLGENEKTCPQDCLPPPQPCTLTSASWSQKKVTEGTLVQLIVEGTNCDGEEIAFEIWEDDGIFPNDYIVTLTGTFDGTTWIAEYVEDQWRGPEYFFIARAEGSNPVSSGNLKVSEGPQLAYCGDGICQLSAEYIINDGEERQIVDYTNGMIRQVGVIVEDTNTATITVDGVSKSKDEGWTGIINGLLLYVKNVVGSNVAGAIKYVELEVGENSKTCPQDCVEANETCTDSDGGLNYNVKGLVTSTIDGSSEWDWCVTENNTEYLFEGTCDEGELVWIIYDECEYGCEDGACRSQPA